MQMKNFSFDSKAKSLPVSNMGFSVLWGVGKCDGQMLRAERTDDPRPQPSSQDSGGLVVRRLE